MPEASSVAVGPREVCADCYLPPRVQRLGEETSIIRQDLKDLVSEVRATIDRHDAELRDAVRNLSEVVLRFNSRLDRQDESFNQLLEQLSEAVATTKVDKKRREKAVETKRKRS